MKAPDAKPAEETAGTPDAPYNPAPYPQRLNSGALIIGLILISIGALFLIDRLLPNIHFRIHDFWPAIIVVAGLALIYSSFSGSKKS